MKRKLVQKFQYYNIPMKIYCILQQYFFKVKGMEYQEICQIGEGAFGRVYKAIGPDQAIVAIKQIKFQSEQQGIPSSALRQISLLKSLKPHPNIVPLIAVQYKPKQKNLKMIFQFYDYDLKKYLHSKHQKLQEKEIKSILKQILSGLAHCHSRKVLHRDMKTQNILIDTQGCVKIADFGLGRVLNIPMKSLTHQVQTLWYRAPQILLGQQKYTFAVDVWAVGCIFAELVIKKPFFMGSGYEIEQIFAIFQIMGTPTNQSWPGISTLPDYKPTFPKWQKKSLKNILPSISQSGIDLLEKLLELNPDQRITALEALQHQYFNDV